VVRDVPVKSGGGGGGGGGSSAAAADAAAGGRKVGGKTRKGILAGETAAAQVAQLQRSRSAPHLLGGREVREAAKAVLAAAVAARPPTLPTPEGDGGGGGGGSSAAAASAEDVRPLSMPRRSSVDGASRDARRLTAARVSSPPPRAAPRRGTR